MKTGLLVLGMHRGGTSALTGCLPPFGVELSPDLMPPDPRNAKGFFESRQVCMMMDRFLSECESFWHDWRPLDIDKAGIVARHAVCRDLAGLINRDFSDSAVFALKDPRNCRAIPIWLSVFSKLNVEPSMVILLRHPVCVAMSLAERDGMALDKALFLWLRHMLDVERETRSCNRTFILFDDLFEDWRPSMEKVGRLIGHDWADASAERHHAVELHLSESLRHYVPNRSAAELLRAVGPWFEHAWAELSRCALDEREPDAGGLDEIDASFTETCRHFTRYFSQAERELELLKKEAMALRRRTTLVARSFAYAGSLERAAARRFRRLLKWQ